ncbi:MAG: hypothetical protein ACXVNF_12670, partial [Neobacillus sp.]
MIMRSKKIIMFLAIFFICFTIFMKPQNANAASDQNLVVLSALSYSVLDSQKAPINLSAYNYNSDKLADIKNKFNEAKSRGFVKDKDVVTFLKRT